MTSGTSKRASKALISNAEVYNAGKKGSAISRTHRNAIAAAAILGIQVLFVPLNASHATGEPGVSERAKLSDHSASNTGQPDSFKSEYPRMIRQSEGRPFMRCVDSHRTDTHRYDNCEMNGSYRMKAKDFGRQIEEYE
jgi:hypothetical protein